MLALGWNFSLASHEIFTVNGMLCRAVGPLAAPCLVTVHAFSSNGTDFLPLFDTPLAQDYRLVAVDLPGFGASPGQTQCRTIAEHAAALADLAMSLSNSSKLGFVAHSVGSMIAVQAISVLKDKIFGLFSIEGNLTADDAYFSGKAADFSDAIAFKRYFLEHLWTMGNNNPIFRSFYANASIADAEAMWRLGCDVRRLSIDDAPGLIYLSIPAPSRYYWNVENVPLRTVDWIKSAAVPNLTFTGASHWPMIEIPADTAKAIGRFFENLV